jgi:ubiquinone biosynthesis protein UbiJ
MRIPDAVHELIEWELAVAYHQGYQAALAEVAAGQAELDEAWRPVGHRRHDEQVADRIAEMRRHAQRLRAELDRLDAHAGAVWDWPPVAEPGRQAA